MTTEEKFNAAVNVIRSLPKNGSYQPSHDLMLKFYSYFKQATQGPCLGPRPAFWDPVGRAKYDAWKKLGDMSRTAAMEQYIHELHSIVETMSYSDNVANFLEASNELDGLNINDLNLVVGDVIERVRSQPNSPLASREGSPSRLISSLSSSPSVSPTPLEVDSDISDDEYIDTIENPEPRKYIPSSETLSNGCVPHVSRSRTRSQSSTNIDISQEITKTVQSLKSDIERLNNKITSVEIVQKKVKDHVKTNGIFGGISPQILVLIFLWPFIATFVTNRFLLNRNK